MFRALLLTACLCSIPSVATAQGDGAESQGTLDVREYPEGSIPALQGGYLVMPSNPAPRPLVVLSHGRWNLADDLKVMAHQLAEMGLTVFLRDVQPTAPSNLTPLKAAVDYLIDQPYVDREKLGLVGFCAGGYASLYFAATMDIPLTLVVSFYGPFSVPERIQQRFEHHIPPLFDFIDRITVPVQAHYGTADHVIPISDPQRLESDLLSRGREAKLFLYEGAEHGFCDHTHGNFNSEACDLAFERLKGFLKEKLLEPR